MWLIYNGTGANNTNVLYPVQEYSKCIATIMAFVSSARIFGVHAERGELRVFDRTPSIVRATHNTRRPSVGRLDSRAPVGAVIVGPGAMYPSLCAEVLNAIMQYKDTIGNSMARVLCSAHTTWSLPRPDFLPAVT